MPIKVMVVFESDSLLEVNENFNMNESLSDMNWIVKDRYRDSELNPGSTILQKKFTDY
jgi:hypothetical protein